MMTSLKRGSVLGHCIRNTMRESFWIKIRTDRMFVCLRPCQQFFSYVEAGLPGLNQYSARINGSYSRTQPRDAGEAGTSNLRSLVKHSTTDHCTPTGRMSVLILAQTVCRWQKLPLANKEFSDFISVYLVFKNSLLVVNKF